MNALLKKIYDTIVCYEDETINLVQIPAHLTMHSAMN